MNRRLALCIAGTIALGLWSNVWSNVAFAADAAVATTDSEARLEALCAKAKPAFVFIAGGSGVVIQPDGLMLTNTHVIENGKEFDVRLGTGRHYAARLLGRDVFGDLAVLQLVAKDGEPFPFLELGDSDALQVGEPAMAIGNPFGLGLVDQHPTFTFGIISAVRQFQGRYTECIVTDAEVNPGNSGGPLINMAGQVVGINGQISTRWGLRSNTGLGYAISARQVRMWLPLLKAANGGNVNHGRPVGIELQRAAADSADSLVIKGVEKGTTAESAGFQASDRIVAWDGQKIPNAIRLLSLVGMYPAGHEVAVEVRRGEENVKLTVTLVDPDRKPAAKPDKPATAGGDSPKKDPLPAEPPPKESEPKKKEQDKGTEKIKDAEPAGDADAKNPIKPKGP
ncbi:MAG: PDZ domain-containing protein [Planctomycetaceae bacterium]|nr:MAG: PDZ domain-containing protein [Planctomycetaceae bacterium]